MHILQLFKVHKVLFKVSWSLLTECSFSLISRPYVLLFQVSEEQTENGSNFTSQRSCILTCFCSFILYQWRTRRVWHSSFEVMDWVDSPDPEFIPHFLRWRRLSDTQTAGCDQSRTPADSNMSSHAGRRCWLVGMEEGGLSLLLSWELFGGMNYEGMETNVKISNTLLWACKCIEKLWRFIKQQDNFVQAKIFFLSTVKRLSFQRKAVPFLQCDCI